MTRILDSSFTRLATAAVVLASCASAGFASRVAAADDATAEAAYAEIGEAFGTVPTFVKQFPKAAIAGAWAELRDLELSDQTALSPKVKSLISLAVAAQIPCDYCIWADTNSARAAGATDEEIAEAVAMAALTRHWSTVFNGLQVDIDQFKAELGGN